MGNEKMLQFPSRGGCVYMYSQAEKKWFKLYPAYTLPPDVKMQVRELWETADALKDAE